MPAGDAGAKASKVLFASYLLLKEKVHCTEPVLATRWELLHFPEDCKSSQER